MRVSAEVWWLQVVYLCNLYLERRQKEQEREGAQIEHQYSHITFDCRAQTRHEGSRSRELEAGAYTVIIIGEAGNSNRNSYAIVTSSHRRIQNSGSGRPRSNKNSSSGISSSDISNSDISNGNGHSCIIRMRRSGSSSCMLKAKGESRGGPLSVTILNTEQMPNYSCERFYMLSELEVHSQAMVFLDDYDCDETIETTDSSLTDARNIPQHLILYVLWADPDMSARVFAESVLYRLLQQLDGLVDLDRPSETKRRCQSVPHINVAEFLAQQRREEQQEEQEQADMSRDNGNDDADKDTQDEWKGNSQEDAPHQSEHKTSFPTAPKSSSVHRSASASESSDSTESDNANRAKLYVVVDKVCHPASESAGTEEAEAEADQQARDDDQEQFRDQSEIAQALARMAASHSKMRRLCQGITVGLSNHHRAAPGLEACMDAVMLGSSDRRRHGTSDSDKRSPIGLVVPKRSDLMGVQDQGVTDAVQGVKQCRFCAEWRGRGPLQTFASNVHMQWREAHGIHNPPATPGKTRRRSRRTGNADPGLMDMIAATAALAGWLFALFYFWQHWETLLGSNDHADMNMNMDVDVDVGVGVEADDVSEEL